MAVTKQTRKKTTHKLRALKRHAVWHYHTKMPEKKHWRIAIWLVFFSYALVVAFQLLYPPDKALPTATLLGEPVGGQSHVELAATLEKKFQATTLELITAGKKSTHKLASAGAEVEAAEALKRAEDYPFWQRFVPLSIFLQPAYVSSAQVTYADTVLAGFSKKQAAALASKPKNARLTIKKGELKAVDDVPGVQVKAGELERAIKQKQIDLGEKNSVHVPAKTWPAQTTSDDFRGVKTKAEDILARTLTIEADGTIFTPSRGQIASWLVIGVNKKNKPTLKFDTKKFDAYITTIDAKVAKPAGVTRVSIVDGRETSRKKGAKGRAIARQPLIASAEQWAMQGNVALPLVATLRDVSPSVVYDRGYSSSQAGLQAYLNDTAGRMDVRITVQQVGGKGWSASVRTGESLPSASTYKLYVAKWIFSQMDKGKMKWNDRILDTTVSECFNRMIIASTNACAEEWLRKLGRSKMNNFVYGLGFSRGTTFTHPTATHTTPNDLRQYMLGLNSGSLVSGAHRDRLMSALASHQFRQGVPAGSNGRVHDKVGFLWDYVHDAAIVKHPRGTYVIVVMTKGQSYARIAEITRQVERIMYP